MGHQDPEWRPDGQFLLYVRNGRDGSRGAPHVMRYNPAKEPVKEMTGPGYLQPSYSPDGKYIAATKTSAIGSDVVILDGSTGKEVMRLTDDATLVVRRSGRRPGDGARLPAHRRPERPTARQARWRRRRTGRSPSTIDLTVVSGLDADSGPDWFIPADQLPATPPPHDRPDRGPERLRQHARHEPVTARS